MKQQQQKQIRDELKILVSRGAICCPEDGWQLELNLDKSGEQCFFLGSTWKPRVEVYELLKCGKGTWQKAV